MGTVIDSQGHALVLNANVRALNLAYEQPWFRYLLNRAELVYCDGAGVRLGTMISGGHLPGRITLADWAWELAEFAAARGYSLYFLGARPGVAEKAAARLQERFRSLQIAGTHHGYFNKEVDHPENLAVVDHINRVRPDVLIMGFGMPLQERWLLENWDRLDARTALAGGAAFDFISGDLKRAPAWMNDHGMEWLGRFLIEPRRLWHRYLVGNPLFLWRVLRYRLTGKLPNDPL
jgi:N-acetylglucosaminyldiphosphoundecaprenol N-acetyl-beta-D-mannosaminyltransferase